MMYIIVVHDLKMIHTDLKPENILLKHHECSDITSSRTKVSVVNKNK